MKKATFYIIRCFNEDESFYKVGITSKTVKERYFNSKVKTKMPYDYEILEEVKGAQKYIRDLEDYHKRELKMYHYEPKMPFRASPYTQLTPSPAHQPSESQEYNPVPA